MRISVIIPVYNEAATVAVLHNQVLETGLADEIILVDDGSTDGSPAVLAGLVRKGNTKVLTQASNQGKGAALRRGLTEATGDILLSQDADLEYEPANYPALLKPILEGRAGSGHI